MRLFGREGPDEPPAGARPLSTMIALSLVLGIGACDSSSDLGLCGPSEADERLLLAGSAERWGRPPEFVELWRVGGTREDQVLGYPAGLAISSAGRAAVPDFMLGEVVVVEADGSWRGGWLPRGPGPGEVRLPVAAAWVDDSRLTVWDVGAAKLVTRSYGETSTEDRAVDFALNSVIVQSGEVLYAAVQRDGSILTIRSEAVEAAGDDGALLRQVLVRASPGAAVHDTLAAVTFETVEATWPRPGSVGLTVATGPDGSVAVADSLGRYRIHTSTPNGDRTVLCRPVHADSLSEQEVGQSVPEGWEGPAASLAAAEPSPRLAAIGRLFFDADRRLWVQRDRPRPFGDGDRILGVPGARYDVFTHEGAYLGEVVSPPEARLQNALGDTVWAFVRGSLDETWIVAYEMR